MQLSKDLRDHPALENLRIEQINAIRNMGGVRRSSEERKSVKLQQSPHIWVDKDKLEFKDGLAGKYLDGEGSDTEIGNAERTSPIKDQLDRRIENLKERVSPTKPNRSERV